MDLNSIVKGGFLKDYKVKILGGLAVLTAAAAWAVGDMSLADLLAKMPVLFAGLGLWALGSEKKAEIPPEQDDPNV